MYTPNELERIQQACTECEHTRTEVSLKLERTHHIQWPRRMPVRETIFMVFNYAPKGIPYYTQGETEENDEGIHRAGPGVYLSIMSSNIQELHERNDNKMMENKR